MMPALTAEGAAMVLRDVYTASARIRIGDALKATGAAQCAPCTVPTDNALGLAYNSADVGQSVSIVIAGLWRTLADAPIQGGQDLTPGPQGRARAAQAGNRRHAVAVDDQPVAGRAVRVLVKP